MYKVGELISVNSRYSSENDKKYLLLKCLDNKGFNWSCFDFEKQIKTVLDLSPLKYHGLRIKRLVFHV